MPDRPVLSRPRVLCACGHPLVVHRLVSAARGRCTEGRCRCTAYQTPAGSGHEHAQPGGVGGAT